MRPVPAATILFVIVAVPLALHRSAEGQVVNCPYIDSSDGFACSLYEPCCGDNTKNPSCLDTAHKKQCCIWYKSAIQCGEKQACCGQYGPDKASSQSFCCDEGSMCCHSQYLTGGASCCPQGSTCCPGFNGGVCCGPDEFCVNPNQGICQKKSGGGGPPATNAPAVPTPSPPQPTSVPATPVPTPPQTPSPPPPQTPTPAKPQTPSPPAPPAPPTTPVPQTSAPATPQTPTPAKPQTPGPPTAPQPATAAPPTSSPPSNGGTNPTPPAVPTPSQEPSSPAPEAPPNALPTDAASPAPPGFPPVPTTPLLTTPTPRARLRAAAATVWSRWNTSMAFALGGILVAMFMAP